MFEPISLFSIDIHKVYVEEWSEHKDRMLSYMTDGYSDKTISFSDYFTYIRQGQYPPYRNEFLELMSKYVEEYLEYIKKLGHIINTKDPNGTYNFSKIEGPWCQKYKSGDYHAPHDHGSIGWSCVLYAKMNPEVHPSTHFFSPFTNHLGVKENRMIRVDEGDLIIFPASLMHMAPPHFSETEERIIISFNINLNGV